MLKHSFIQTAVASLTLALCGSSFAADNYTTSLNKLKASPGEYSWIQERSIENIDFASMILCIIRNTGANHQDSIDAGPYVAKITAGMCEKNSSQTSSAATGDAPAGVDYEYFIVDSKRVGNNLDIKLWVRPTDKELAEYTRNIDWISEIHAHVLVDLTKASQVGFEQLHWVHLPVDTSGNATSVSFNDKKGYGVIIPTKTGNDFDIKYANKQYFSGQNIWLTQTMNILRTGDGETTPITLNGFTKSFDYGNNNQVSEVSFKVAANKDRFARRKFVNGTPEAEICYDRSPSQVKFNTWDYALFDSTTKELKEISGSSDLSITINGANYRGNYRMSDMWFPEDAVNVIGANGVGRASSDAYPVKVQSGTTVKDGLLTMKHGGLRKVTNSETTLGDLKGVPFDTWVCSNSCSNVSIKWNGSAFVKADGSAFTIPSGWGDIWLNSNGVGYRVRGPIDSNNQPDWTRLSDAWKAVSRTESRVSDTELATLANTTLNCVAGCPDVAVTNNVSRINGYSANEISGSLNQKTNGSGYTYKVSADGQLKLWNGSATASDNLVVNRFTRESVARLANWSGTDGFGSGALVPATAQGFASLADLQAYFPCSWDNNTPKRYVCGWNKELPSTVTYYTWRTGTVRWDKDWDLRVDGHNPAMDEPIMVSYTCPANRDCEVGTKYVLRYEGNQNLNGIPNRCVKAENFNEQVDCNTYSGEKQWLNRFNLTRTSATADAVTDYVTDIKNPSKTYLVLPQGSMEYYPVASTCGINTNSVTQGDINIDDYFRQDMVEIGPMPIDILKSKVVFQDGRPTKSLP